jgi:hypothetical protein
MTAAVLLAAVVAAGTRPDLLVWRLESGRVAADPGAPQGPLPVGSLVKPFLAEAWARSHPGETPPRATCDARSRCWRPSGHGTLGLARALAVSCNTYFARLAAEIPREQLAETLRAEGFVVEGPLSPSAALGLDGNADAPTVEPTALLVAYERLLTRPWAAEEDAVRGEVLAGLRESARLGTARGARAVLGKTGTVPSLRGLPQHTSGWALVAASSGTLRLALLRDGTGREAAVALGTGPGATPNAIPPTIASARVRVQLLDALHPRQVLARVAGGTPLATSRGFVGPGQSVSLRPEDRLEDGLWELRVPGLAFSRKVRGRLRVDAASGAVLRLVAEVTPDEYVAGVLLAELPDGEPARRLDLAAAILRFVASGPRHEAADVCDRTHCAWFVGRGPQVLWPTPVAPVLLREPGGPLPSDTPPFDEATWSAVVAASRHAGPSQWSTHCGGAPLSAHFVWGNGDRRVWSCPRHPGPSASWTRDWPAVALARAFGGRVLSLDVEADDVWSLRVRTERGLERFRFDDARRRLASAMGGGPLPAPAARVSRVTDGFRAEGVGRGHRVGLCLAN